MVLDREECTVNAMIQLYCRGNNASRQQPCDNCAELESYALRRLDRCPFGSDKPICASCSIHCYHSAMREQIQEVMRYAGPKMALRRPVLAVGHVLDKCRATPASRSKRESEPRGCSSERQSHNIRRDVPCKASRGVDEARSTL